MISSYVYDTDPGHGSARTDFFESSLFNFHSLCKVSKKPVTSHKKSKKLNFGVVLPSRYQIESQLFTMQRFGNQKTNKKKTI